MVSPEVDLDAFGAGESEESGRWSGGTNNPNSSGKTFPGLKLFTAPALITRATKMPSHWVVDPRGAFSRKTATALRHPNNKDIPSSPLPCRLFYFHFLLFCTSAVFLHLVSM